MRLIGVCARSIFEKGKPCKDRRQKLHFFSHHHHPQTIIITDTNAINEHHF